MISCFAAASREANAGASAGANAETVAEALAFFGLAGEDAAPNSEGPGTFEPRLLDALATLAAAPERLEGRLRTEEVPA